MVNDDERYTNSSLETISPMDATNEDAVPNVSPITETCISSRATQVIHPPSRIDVVLDNIDTPSLDLNRNPATNCSHYTRDGSTDSMGTNEIIQTVEIGAELGFQIEADNLILAQVVGESRVQTHVQ
ncbi:hypothetical protein L1887_38370 [Cichorium endivia]|nr:hypothetical protein L1887_38370 [Cichorium endivia]